MAPGDFLPTMAATNVSYQRPFHQAFKVMVPSSATHGRHISQVHNGALQGLFVFLQVPKKTCM